MANKFKWQDSALVADSTEINIPVYEDGTPKLDGDKPVTEKVLFYELPRLQLIQFMTESLELKVVRATEEMIDQPDPVTGDTIKVPKLERIPFAEVAEQHSAFIFKFLAMMTRGKKDAAYFETLPLGITGLTAFVEMMNAVNHVEEVLGSSGNFLMLPTIHAMLSSAGTSSETESVS